MKAKTNNKAEKLSVRKMDKGFKIGDNAELDQAASTVKNITFISKSVICLRVGDSSEKNNNTVSFP